MFILNISIQQYSTRRSNSYMGSKYKKKKHKDLKERNQTVVIKKKILYIKFTQILLELKSGSSIASGYKVSMHYIPAMKN